MASKGIGSMDDDSFSARVAKAFAALVPSSAPLSNPSPWTLSGHEVERKRWKLDDKDTSARDEMPCSSSFDDLLRKGRRQRSFRDDDDDAGDRDEWEVRSSIGLDSTLDNEEEEDEFDKIAAGREKHGDRLYMNQVTDRGPYLNMHNVLPNSLKGVAKDTRANHHAARIRLKEDEAEAEAENVNFSHSGCGTEIKESNASVSENSGQLKSILKRKDNSADSKPQKRVRFNPDGNEAAEKFEYSSSGTPSMISTDPEAQNVSRVPDYLLNPSKYTHYSFDSSEHNEESDIKACFNLLEVVKSSNAEELGPEPESASGNHPKSVNFIPKKRATDIKDANISSEIKENKEDTSRQFLSQPAFPVGIAAGESRHTEVIPFDEIELEMNATDYNAPVKKPGRNYRMQSRSEDSDS